MPMMTHVKGEAKPGEVKGITLLSLGVLVLGCLVAVGGHFFFRV